MTAAGAADRVAVIRAMFAAIEAGDVDGVLALVAEDAEWSPSAWSGPGRLRGRSGVRLWLNQFGPGIRHLRIELDEVLAGKGPVVALGTVTDTRAGGHFAVRVGWVFEVEDGLVRRGTATPTWDAARHAAGL